MDKAREKMWRESDLRAIKHEIENARSWRPEERAKFIEADNREAAFGLMKRFIEAVRDGQEVEPILLQYFADCFSKFLNLNGDNKYWPECMNTYRQEGNPGRERRDRLLNQEYAAHLNKPKEKGNSKEAFINEVIENPPEYWEGNPPTRDNLLKILYPKNHNEIRSAQAIDAELERVLSKVPE
ncbi:hypothetical protein ACJJI5_05070 [Microbulbifer sp. EKSA008]|uniref:hypothetical protein n=1 Tax=Microbulbifer sp. EKSA008 TaxID=3243367 RepID=UPI00404128C7